MDVRPETSSRKLKGPETDSPWILTTPVKPGLTSLQSICTEKQDFQSIQENWVNLEQISQQTQARQGNCLESDSCNWEAAVAAKSQLHGDALGIYNKFSMEDADQWSKVSFKNLLALADAAGAAAAAENASIYTAFNAESRSSTPVSSSQIECLQFQTVSRNSSQANKGFLLESTLQNASDTAIGRTAISSQHFFDLNLAPRTVINATSSAGILSQFEPITPDQNAKRANKEKRSDMQNLCINEAAKETVTTTFELNEHQNEGQSELVENESCAPMSALLENHKPDMGSNQNTDLKTLPQKPRRRKHRPKVVIEGQPKRTSIPRTTKPAGSDGVTRVKRKYVRKNRVSEPGDTPLEGRTTTLETMSPGSEEKPKSKRKYVRRNIINEPKTTPSEEASHGATDVKATRATRKSCRRSLNFDSESHVVGEKSKNQSSSDLDAKSRAQISDEHDQSRTTMDCGQGMDVILEKKEAGIDYDLTQPMNHALEDYLSIKESQAPCLSTSLKIDQLHDKLVIGHPLEYTRGKCQIVFSDTTHDKEANILVKVSSDDQSATRSPSISNCSSTAYLTQERQAGGSKRQRFSTTDESDSCSINATGAQCNSLEVYLKILPSNVQNEEGIPGMHFPATHKKKRTGKGSKSATSSMLPTLATTDYCVRSGAYQHNDICGQAFTSESKFRLPATYCDPTSGPTKIATADGAHNEQQYFKCLQSMGSTDRYTKKRSKGPTRVRDLTSLLEICKPLLSSSTKGLAPSAPHTCKEALVANTRARLTTKKRSKRNVVGSSPNTYNHHQVLTKSMGLPAAIMWKNMSPMDAIVEQFNRLDIDAESNKFSNREQNAVVAYHQEYPGQNTLVVYQSDGTMIPFYSPFDHARKRRPRPKVDLDDETTRVWKLLLEDINSEGIDGTDEQKAKWWQGERKVFRGRAKTFIARMRLVQGDRHFTPWKGSVVDSVVGVFLTQNVSDHLSSSAFISMTARFPLNSCNHEPSCEEGTSEEPEVLDPDYTIGWHKKVSNQQTSDQHSMTLQGIKYNEEGEINHRDFFGITSEGIKSAENSKFLSDSSEYSPNIYDEAEVDKLGSQNIRTLASLDGVQRELDDIIFSQNSAVSPQNSVDSISQATYKTESCSPSSSGAEPTYGDCGSTSFVKLLQMAGTTALHGIYNHRSMKRSSNMERPTKSDDTVCNSQRDQEPRDFDPLQNSRLPDNFKENELSATEQSGLSEESAAAAASEKIIALTFEEVHKFSGENCTSADNHRMPAEDQETELNSNVQKQRNNQSTRQDLTCPVFSDSVLDGSERTNFIDKTSSFGGKAGAGESNLSNGNNLVETVHGMNPSSSKAKRVRNGKEKKIAVDWDGLRQEALANGKRTGRRANTMDSVDWEAVRCAPVEEIAQTIKERGMNNMLAERIKDFLNRLVRDHGSIDLEWLRDVPPDKAKEYLLSIRGLGLKSVECVRLLTLHHLAFPVDTNVGRIAVRLGWVPLQPLPESLQLHLLELYPVLESIQKYLWPRLCKLDQGTLYELHYQMITFGKVFCTKNKPNCNSCPMRGECRHFASAFASARLALPAPEEKRIISATKSKSDDRNPAENINYLQLPQPPANQPLEVWPQVKNSEPIIEEPATPEPLIEMPATPEPEETRVPEIDIEDTFPEDAEGIPTIDLNLEELNRNLQNIIQNNVELQRSAMSKALVVLTPEAASIPMAKLKNISRLRTEHRVYELPDTHQLLKGLDKREPDDPCPYLLSIWTPGETVNSIQPPERRCGIQESGELCDEETCFSCNSVREARSQTVRGTLLIPCRTAMRGSFPLNGTYFQVNEVFADHESSLNPIDVPRDWLWNLTRRTVYFGTSIPTIFKGLLSLEIQYCFWRGFVCVRGFDRKTRAPRPLIARLHFPASKMTRMRGRTDES